jgi:hypothetical protein
MSRFQKTKCHLTFENDESTRHKNINKDQHWLNTPSLHQDGVPHRQLPLLRLRAPLRVPLHAPLHTPLHAPLCARLCARLPARFHARLHARLQARSTLGSVLGSKLGSMLGSMLGSVLGSVLGSMPVVSIANNPLRISILTIKTRFP